MLPQLDTMRPTTLREVAKRLFDNPHWPMWKPMGEFLDEFYVDGSEKAEMIRDEPVAPIPENKQPFWHLRPNT